jgi:hypothetical protein
MPLLRNESAYSSGDPNFAAALMTVGCPPCEPAVKLIASDDGHDYVSFRIRDRAIDGTMTSVFSQAWSSPVEMGHLAKMRHGFAIVAAFTKGKPRNTGPSRDAWIEHLAGWCGITRDAARDAINGVVELCNKSPESELSYCAAFIANRFHLLDIARDFQNTGNVDVFMNHGSGFSLISEKLTERQRAYLLRKRK